MAHNLEIRIIDGVESASFAYAIRPGTALPWHGLGLSHDGLMTVDEALVKSRTGALVVSKYEHRHNGVACGTYGIQRHDIRTEGGEATPMRGVSVGEDYSVVQYGDAVRNFADAAFGSGARVTDTMGILGNGERMFTTFLGETTDIRPNDPITSYNILSTSHDGTGAVLWFGSDTRVVCQNTLRIALANMRNTISIRHTKNAQPNVNAACKALALAAEIRAKRVEAFKVMGNREVSVAEFKMFLDALYPLKRDGDGKEETGGKTVAKRERLTALFEGAATGSRLAGKTAWGVFQAVTQDADETARGQQPWLTSLLNGTQNDTRQRAFDYLLALCEGHAVAPPSDTDASTV